MNNLATSKYIIRRLLDSGADKAQCRITKTEKHELNIAIGNISLFRTTFNTGIDLLGLVNNKKGTLSINKTDTDSIENGIHQVLTLAGSSKPDPANDIAGYQPPKNFNDGPAKADLDKMYFRLNEFLDYTKKTFPNTILEELCFDFTNTESILVNSNGVEFTSNNSAYNLSIVFTSKDGTDTSSMNYVECRFRDLNSPIKDIGGVNRLLQQSAQQIRMAMLPEKFDGPIIMTPECLTDFINFLAGYLSNIPIITGSSVYRNKLNHSIADNRLTLHSKPVSSEPALTYYFTDDGFEAQNSTIIANGVLKSFILNLYAANKTGLPRSENMGGCYVIEAGDTALDQIIRDTPKGILLCRFSGGFPGDNGDFSGVAKNSYYIEDGKIQYPIRETMISGNIVNMLNNIAQISKERNNDGYNLLPWIKFNGITISGK